MKHSIGRLTLFLIAAFVSSSHAPAAPLAVTVTNPPPPITTGFRMGDSRSPDGQTLTLDSHSLLLNGKPWTPVMGEFHYSRVPENEWREELLKMKAGGIDIVSTYVFWIHHEEIEGQFDWSGSRNLRRFIQTVQEVGLKACVRCGPWDHGEVRNGGFPDWLMHKGWKLRSNDTNYLAKVKILYGEIAKQLDGLYWKDGGPIIGIQFENEYNGPAAHLLTLKQLGEEAGFDAPLYTRTGWNTPSGKMPFGELVPLYGVYAEGFWDRSLQPMPAGYWKSFQFSPWRVDDATFMGAPGHGGTPDPVDADKYPYLTCEIGGGMMNSYHRRILFNPEDAEATTLVKLGSGSTLLGYYMYHGGVNPEGKLTTLMESQATGYWNDMPVKNYDFQAPLGQYGQVCEQYHRLRRLHLFLHEWGSLLADMPVTMPDERPQGQNDSTTLRWSVRSDGTNGFVFVNNYERHQRLPPKQDVRFMVNLPTGTITFPEKPITIPSNACLLWPFHLNLGHNVQLAWATAQPLTAVDVENVRTIFFEQADGIPAQFAFATNGSTVQAHSGHITRAANINILEDVMPGTKPIATFAQPDGSSVQLVVLDAKDALRLWKGNFDGRDRAFLSSADLVFDGNALRVTSTNLNELDFAIYPAPDSLLSGGRELKSKADGTFKRFIPPAPNKSTFLVSFSQTQKPGPVRKISMGAIEKPVATAPVDTDFAAAAVWTVTLPSNIDLATDPILRIHYVGDVARVLLNGKFITDDFYNGNAFDIGLRRHAPEILNGKLQIAVLPLQKDAPIFMADQARPDFGKAESLAEIQSIEIVPRYQSAISAK